MSNVNSITEAVEQLRQGKLILLPSDTFWSVGCDATSSAAVDKLIALSDYQRSDGLTILFDRPERIPSYVDELPDMAWDLIDMAESPLTLILPNPKNLTEKVLLHNGSIAVRVPRSSLCRDLITRFNRPLAVVDAVASDRQVLHDLSPIPDEILEAVDFRFPQSIPHSMTAKPAGIIALWPNGMVKVIRE